MRFEVGPLTIEGEAWPPAWLSYAEERFGPRLDARGRTIQLSITSTGHEGPPPRSDAPQRMHVLRRDGDWWIEVPDGFRARFVDAFSKIDVIDHSSALLAHFTLGNLLRGVCSLVLPLEMHGLVVHASSVLHQDLGLVFAGLSGAGKSTLAHGMPEGRYVSDDFSMIGRLDGVPLLLPSPFHGVFSKKGAQREAPLAAICVLTQAPQTQIRRLSRAEAISGLARHVVSFSQDPELARAMLERLDELTSKVPCFAVTRSLNDTSVEVCDRVLASLSEPGEG